MHDAAAWRQQTHMGKRLFAPLQEGEPLGITLTLDPLIERASVRPAAMHRNQSMVDNRNRPEWSG